jgi:hypothetical protein
MVWTFSDYAEGGERGASGTTWRSEYANGPAANGGPHVAAGAATTIGATTATGGATCLLAVVPQRLVPSQRRLTQFMGSLLGAAA